MTDNTEKKLNKLSDLVAKEFPNMGFVLIVELEEGWVNIANMCNGCMVETLMECVSDLKKAGVKHDHGDEQPTKH
jgi:hypothetical protein